MPALILPGKHDKITKIIGIRGKLASSCCIAWTGASFVYIYTNSLQFIMDPLEDKFFIDNPEELKNNFFDENFKKKFEKEFKNRSKEIVQVSSKIHRHAKKLRKKRESTNK